MSKNASNLLTELLTEQYETEKIKTIFRKAYRCGHGEDYKDTAFVVNKDEYRRIRKWLGED